MDWKNKLQMDIDNSQSSDIEHKKNEYINFDFSTKEQSIVTHEVKNETDNNDTMANISLKELEICGFSVLAWLGLIALSFPHTTNLDSYSFLGINANFILFLLEFVTFISGSVLISLFVHDNISHPFFNRIFSNEYISIFKPMKKRILKTFFASILSIAMGGIFSTILPTPIKIEKPVIEHNTNKNNNTNKDIILAETSKPRGNYQDMVDLANAQQQRDEIDKITAKKEYELNQKYLLETLKLKQEYDKYNVDSEKSLTNNNNNLSLIQLKEENSTLKQELDNMKLKKEISLLKK